MERGKIIMLGTMTGDQLIGEILEWRVKHNGDECILMKQPFLFMIQPGQGGQNQVGFVPFLQTSSYSKEDRDAGIYIPHKWVAISYPAHKDIEQGWRQITNPIMTPSAPKIITPEDLMNPGGLKLSQ